MSAECDLSKTDGGRRVPSAWNRRRSGRRTIDTTDNEIKTSFLAPKRAWDKQGLTSEGVDEDLGVSPGDVRRRPQHLGDGGVPLELTVFGRRKWSGDNLVEEGVARLVPACKWTR
uniref:Uncharacterized protein n=1 Tax=Steinernema glaseri TaxID=37863 RepID=A0A1I7ZFM9_9BILA